VEGLKFAPKLFLAEKLTKKKNTDCYVVTHAQKKIKTSKKK